VTPSRLLLRSFRGEQRTPGARPATAGDLVSSALLRSKADMKDRQGHARFAIIAKFKNEAID
jgi:hypothetical protein